MSFLYQVSWWRKRNWQQEEHDGRLLLSSYFPRVLPSLLFHLLTLCLNKKSLGLGRRIFDKRQIYIISTKRISYERRWRRFFFIITIFLAVLFCLLKNFILLCFLVSFHSSSHSCWFMLCFTELRKATLPVFYDVVECELKTKGVATMVWRWCLFWLCALRENRVYVPFKRGYTCMHEAVSCHVVYKRGWELKLYYRDIEANKMSFSFHGFIVRKSLSNIFKQKFGDLGNLRYHMYHEWIYKSVVKGKCAVLYWMRYTLAFYKS